VSKLRKPTVELKQPARPSKIRRDPLHVQESQQLSRDAWWESREWEIRLAIMGIIFVALALNAAVFDIGEFLSR
jgi:hypothetical protein